MKLAVLLFNSGEYELVKIVEGKPAYKKALLAMMPVGHKWWRKNQSCVEEKRRYTFG